MIVAWRRSAGVPRRQYAIVLVGVSVVVVNAVVTAALALAPGDVEPPGVLGALALMAISVAIVIAVVRYRLYNLEVLVNRTVLVVLVGTLLAAVYMAVLLGLSRCSTTRMCCRFLESPQRPRW